MSQYGFGSGSAWAVDSAANPTPAPFGILQDISVDFSFNVKELGGTYAFPVAVGRGMAKIASKAKNARLAGRLLNLFFGGTKAAGQESVAQDEAASIAAGTFTVANGANFVADLGFYNAATGIPFVRVAAAPAVGQYSGPTGAGVYTCNVGDNGIAVKVSYTYSVAGTGEKITITNPTIGVAPTFKTTLTQLFNNLRSTLTLNANVFSKLGIATKLEDFIVPELDYSSFADAANNIGTWSLGEAS